MAAPRRARARRVAPPAPPRRHVVVSIGGSVLFTGEHDARYHRSLAELIPKWAREFDLVLTTGGGRTAREYIAVGRALGLSEHHLDLLGIDVTRLHARLLASRVGAPAPTSIPTTVAAAVRAARRTPIVLLGGTEPGHTTDAVAALIAARLRALRVVNATRVPGLFDRDPRSDPTARRIDAIGWEAFLERVRAATLGRPGEEYVFDRLGAETLAEAGIPLYIVDGRDLPNLGEAIRGGFAAGTIVGAPARTDLSRTESAAP
ncbi:MAG TPA: UMP kinase [Thermoplasmata archaeon]|nr:UMP kinase [Thermoplasmata archaeon]